MVFLKTIGIICEYNPLHLGHLKQIQAIRAHFGADSAICCLMSGNFVQRGAPAIVDKSFRARSAAACGADLVLELPVNYALSSAEGFAAGGVRLLSPFCDALCFGAETGSRESLMAAARALLSDGFPPLLRAQLDRGLSFPAARQQALAQLGCGEAPLALPNDILAVEYCKAILSQHSPMEPFPIPRGGSYHSQQPDREDPSATAVRRLMAEKGHWLDYVPENARQILAEAPLHTLEAGERAVLAKLRTMSDRDFEALPFGSEGLWRKLMHESRRQATLEQVLTAVKSKRYTRTRLQRMVMCAFLGLTREALETPAPYARVLALNDRGREVLTTARESGAFPNAGQSMDHPWQQTENRTGDLYALFCIGTPEPPGAEQRRRVQYIP